MTLLQGDTFELLGRVGAFDHLVTDPPFSEFVHANLRGNKTDQTVIVDRAAGYGPLTSSEREKRVVHWLGVVPGWIVWFSDWESVGDWRRLFSANGGVWGRAVPWDRKQPLRVRDCKGAWGGIGST